MQDSVDLSELAEPRARRGGELLSREEVLAALYCRFEPTLNPGMAEAQAHSVAWMTRQKLLAADGLERTAAARTAWMIAGFYPNAPQSHLNIAADYLTWAFALDDVGDESRLGRRVGALLALFERFEHVFAGGEVRASDHPLVGALGDILRRLSEVCPERCVDAWCAGNRAYWGAMLWEAKNREENRTPEEEEFFALRPATGAVPPFFALIEGMEGFDLTDRIRQDPTFREIQSCAGLVACFINDVLSHNKERAHGDVHNLVMVFERSRGLSAGAALQAAIDLCNSKTRRFEELCAAVPSFDTAGEAAATERYLAVMRSIIRITMDWTYGSSRYHGRSAQELATS